MSLVLHAIKLDSIPSIIYGHHTWLGGSQSTELEVSPELDQLWSKPPLQINKTTCISEKKKKPFHTIKQRVQFDRHYSSLFFTSPSEPCSGILYFNNPCSRHHYNTIFFHFHNITMEVVEIIFFHDRLVNLSCNLSIYPSRIYLRDHIYAFIWFMIQLYMLCKF